MVWNVSITLNEEAAESANNDLVLPLPQPLDEPLGAGRWIYAADEDDEYLADVEPVKLKLPLKPSLPTA